jgi:hypothetical protein
MSENNGRNNRGNTGSSNGRRSVSMSMQFYEPVAANAAIFVAIVVLDLFNKTNALIPVHASAGVVITLMTLALCRYNYITVAWLFAIIPALFLFISFLMAASKNQYVIAAENTIASAYKTGAEDVNYIANQAAKTYKTVADEAVKDVNYLNSQGSVVYDNSKKTIGGVGDSIGNLFGISQDPASISNAWLKAYGAASKAGLDQGSAALAATSIVGSSPDKDTPAGIFLAGIKTQANSTTVSGEFVYLCGDGGKIPPSSVLAEQCKYVNAQCKPDDFACKDKLIGVINIPAVCLGALASGGKAPKVEARDSCLACMTKPGPTDPTYANCLCVGMGNSNCPGVPDTKVVVAGFANYSGISWS